MNKTIGETKITILKVNFSIGIKKIIIRGYGKNGIIFSIIVGCDICARVALVLHPYQLI